MKKLFTSFSCALIALLSGWNFVASAQTDDFSYTGAIQTYTVPAGTTSIGIGVLGGSGGNISGGGSHTAAIGGYAASMYGVFTVTPGQVLKVLVGGAGQDADYCGGGGGGSFVWDNATGTLLIAGGGGGGAGCSDVSHDGIPGLNANTGEIAINGNTMPSGAGSGGTGGVSNGAQYYAAAGAGWLSSGAGGGETYATCSFATSGNTPLTGGAGGNYGGTAGESGNGGFGGGGGAQGRCSAVGGGGGGGYSGGGAGGELASANDVYQPGGGGGSFNTGSNTDNSVATDTGNGGAQIRICPSSLTSSAGSSVCIGGTTTLSANATGGNWTGYGGATISSGGLLTGETAGTALITYKVSNCPATTILININPSPNAGSIAGTDNVCQGLTTTLLESVPGGAWSSSNTSVAAIGAGTGVASGVSAGTVDITYTVTDATTSCTSSALFPLVVTPPCVSGVGTVTNAGPAIKVYPNPNAGTFHVLVSSALDEQATVTITNVIGVKIKELSITANKETDVELNVPAGMYFVNAVTKNSRMTQKLFVNP